jgi:hypothetical protein
MPVMVRNNELGPTVLTVGKEHAFEWKGKGDPNGEDVQHLPDTILEDVNFVKALNKGVFTVEEANEGNLASIARQGESFRERMAAQQQAAMDSIDQEANNDLVQLDCIGPSPRGNGACGASVMVKDKNRDQAPALCSIHESLASQYIITETDTIGDDGRTSKTWQRMTLGQREKAPE